MCKKITIIGAGNMGQAMIGGMLKSNFISQSAITVTDLTQSKLDQLSAKFPGIQTTVDNHHAVKDAEIIIFAVKPIVLKKVIQALEPSVSESQLIVTICAGIATKRIVKWFGRQMRIIRAMPNTPALVNEGMSALCKGEHASDEDLALVRQIFDSFGFVEIVPEYLMDAVTATSGSSPAYAFMFIEAMSDGAVLNGISRDMAIRMAAQSLKGAAEMILSTGKHPGTLKDMVTSPGGTTIEALASLESGGFRSLIIEAMRTCTKKSNEIIID